MSSEATEPNTPVEAVPTCFRHPGREAHIRCARCGRPICPECMIPASVGFQCPDDVRAGAAGVREPRTALGARIGSDVPWVSRFIVAANVVMFVLQQTVSGFTERFIETSGRPSFYGIAAGEWYRLVTATFLHGGLLHLGLNMYMLWIFGTQLESLMGRARFFGLYVVSGLGGSAMSYAFAANGQQSLGASGAIFGVFGAYIVVARRLGRDISQLWLLLGINVVIGFLPNFNIDWRAHAGGLLAGAVIGAVSAYAPRPRSREAFAAAVVILLLVVVATVTWRTAQVHEAPAGRALACELQHPGGGDGYLGCVEPS